MSVRAYDWIAHHARNSAEDLAAIDLHDALRPALAARLGEPMATRVADAVDNLRFAQAAHWLRAEAGALLGPSGPGA